MSSRPTPARLRRAFTLAWLLSQAFTRHLPGAILAYPVCLLTVGIYLPHRQVYQTDDGAGMVIFGRFRIRNEVVAAALLFFRVIEAIVLLGGRFGPLGITLVTLLWLPFAVGLTQLNSGALSMTPVGPETPPGDRWQVAALAQRPGSRLSALLLARRLLSSLPAGAVAVAAAADERLVAAYERFGFTRGKAKRVYVVTSGTPQ